MKRLRGCLGVFLIFFFGVIVGVAITAGGIHKKVRETVEGGPDRVVEVIVKRLDEELKLDATQREMLQKIVLDARIKLRGIWQQTQPQVDETLAEAESKARGILNPDQIPKFEEIVKRGREKWKAKETPPELSEAVR